MSSMSSALWWVLLFVGLLAVLPWAVRRWQAQASVGGTLRGSNSKVLSALAVGPQQRVVTIEVGPENGRTCLVLGVTPQQVQCLYVFPQPVGQAVQASAAAVSAPAGGVRA